MQIRQLEYFIAVAEELSFTRAAKRCFVSQAALSMQVKALEKELGKTLLDRNRHHVTLTASGTVFLDGARDIVARTSDVVKKTREASDVSVAELRVGYIKGYERSGLAGMFANFHRHYPHAMVSLFRGSVDELYDLLRAEELDIVINMRYPEADLGKVEWQAIARYPLVAIMPFDHPLASRQSVSLGDLHGYPVVRHQSNPSCYGETQRIDEVVSLRSLYDSASCASWDIETAMLCVLAGFGYAIVPGFVTPTLFSDSRIVAVPIEGMDWEVEVVAAWLPTTKNELIDVFLDQFLEIDA